MGGKSLSHDPWVGNPFPTTRGWEIPFPRPVGGKSLSHDPWVGNPFPTTRGWEIPFPPFLIRPVGGKSLSHPSAINHGNLSNRH